jgi:hypothetical protein
MFLLFLFSFTYFDNVFIIYSCNINFLQQWSHKRIFPANFLNSNTKKKKKKNVNKKKLNKKLNWFTLMQYYINHMSTILWRIEHLFRRCIFAYYCYYKYKNICNCHVQKLQSGQLPFLLKFTYRYCGTSRPIRYNISISLNNRACFNQLQEQGKEEFLLLRFPIS